MTFPKDERRFGEAAGLEPAGEPRAAPRGNSALPVTLIVIAAVLLLAAAAYTAYWLVAEAELEDRVAGWIEDRRAEGMRIAHGPISRSGFPRRLRLTMPSVAIEAPTGWSWRAPELKVRADPFAPGALRFSVFGEQQVRLPFHGGSDAFTVQADGLDADVVFSSGRLSGRAVGERVSLRPVGAAEAEGLRVGRIEVATTPGPATGTSSLTTGTHISLFASDLFLPAAAQAPLGERIDAVSIRSEITGDAPTDGRGMPWPKALVRWRDSGGTLEVRGFDLDYGPLQLTGDGTVALDKTGEPIAAFSLRATGIIEALRTLADHGVVSRAVAAGAAFVFQAKKGQADNGDQSIALPATVQDGKLYLGPFPIARVPSPPWVPLPESGS